MWCLSSANFNNENSERLNVHFICLLPVFEDLRGHPADGAHNGSLFQGVRIAPLLLEHVAEPEVCDDAAAVQREQEVG